MSYEVLARKWRPQQFDDVVGQEHVTRTLKNAITTGRIANAYLFVGPRGIGKTSIARILAKALNCKNGPTVTPCETCDACREITAGTSLDVMEIDGASNNGVEQVRDLREAVKYAPVRGAFKIYIIDEVHMLSTPAFNALLKTLEEPPPHVRFMFATTEPEKILPTIVSRCQRFDLRRIPVGMIVERLKLIARDENLRVDDDALLAVARGSEGGLRDAESALDQLISFKGNDIAEEDVLAVFGLVSRRTLEDLAGQILAGDIAGLLRTVGALDQAGKDLQRLIVELMEHFRNLLVSLHAGEATAGLDLLETQLDALRKQAATTNADRLLRVSRILGETEERMRYTLSKRTLVETALIRCARSAVVASLDEILQKVLQLQRQAGGEPAAVAPSAAPAVHVAAPEPSRPAAAVREEPPREAAAGLARHVASPAAAPGESEIALLERAWKHVVDLASEHSLRVRGPLADARPTRIEGDKVAIAIDPEFESEIDTFRDARSRKAVERALTALLKRAVSVTFEVGSTVAGALPAERTAPPAADGRRAPAAKGGAEAERPAAKAAAGKSAAGGARRARHELVNDPAVQKAQDVFKAKIVDVREC